jgi:hypothetical protein
MHRNIVGRDAGGNLLHPFAVMECEHRLPDAPPKPMAAQPWGQPDQGPKSAYGGWLLNHKEADNTAFHQTFQHTLIWVPEGVFDPQSIAVVTNFGANLRVNV